MKKSNLRGTAAVQVVALLGAGLTLATPAFAQTTPTNPPVVPAPVPSTSQTSTDEGTPKPVTDTTAAQDVADEGGTIVVTGSILRRTTAATPSPVTIVTADALEQRGTNTIQEGIQNLSSNNGPALTNSFSANGAFAAGASAVSLRGLSTNSTLVLFDGLRAAYYPLADDGSRNFVDLNTVPDDIIERIEVLRDGASSSYGADAIAGVVNIITKREFKGVQARAEAGISSRGDAAQRRLSLTAGVGDLEDKGYNAYISGFYYKSEGLRNRDRGYPFNTDDLRNVCNDDTCGNNGIVNGLDLTNRLNGFGIATPFAVRPITTAGTTPVGTPIDAFSGAAINRYQYLAGCGNFDTYTLTAADRLRRAGTPTSPPASQTLVNGIAPDVVCQEDITRLYGNISPDIKRFGVSMRGTVAVSDVTEAYAEANFIQSEVSYQGLPATIRGNAPTGIYNPRFSTSSGALPNAPGSGILALPVYICANATGTATGNNPTCTATTPGAQLNPYNPFAAQGNNAQLLGRLPNIIEQNATRNRAYRAAIGIKGSFLDGIGYGVNATAMHVDLRRTQDGYVRIQNFLDAIARGQYNFLNPTATPQSVLDFISPSNTVNATSDLDQIEGTLQKDLFQLPGGPVQLGVGLAFRYEAVDAPSGNTDINGPTQRYFRLNAFGASGDRNVYSGYFELNAPILDQLEVNVSGRYDKYSSGQKNFSPKVGVKFTPIKELALRGTYSKGFRIPSFAEANAFPTTGYVSATRTIYNNTFLAQYGCSTATGTGPGSFSRCPAYITGATYGLTSLSSPDLAPEKSRSITLGGIFEPIRDWAMTVDYYDIKKTGAITSPDTSGAIAAYYAGTPIPAGFNVIADSVDPNNPTARPRIAFVESGLINAGEIRSRGIDFSLSGRSNLFGVRWSTALEASYIIELSTTQDGQTLNFAGTLGNYNLTAGSGTPRWKGSFQNTFDFGKLSLTGVVNYFGGYNLSAEDQTGPDTAGECGLSTGIIDCNVRRYITLDTIAQFKLNDQFTLTGTMLNAFDKMPPLDNVTYGAHLYNPVQGGQGIYGRYFRAGVKVNF